MSLKNIDNQEVVSPRFSPVLFRLPISDFQLASSFRGIALSLVCCFVSIFSFGQAGKPEKFVTEHVLLQTDRELYLSGETIWFKMYVLVAQQNRLSDFSEVGYLELVGPDGVAISRMKTLLQDGQCSGTVKLPATMNSGRYVLRAYTQGLRNSGEESFARVSLIILNPEQPLVRSTDDGAPTAPEDRPKGAFKAVSPEDYLHIDIQSVQTDVPQRGEVTLEITTKDATGRPVPAQLSLAAALPSPAGATDRVLFPVAGATEADVVFPVPPMTVAFTPETEGMGLRGRVVNQETGAGEPGTEVYLSFPGKTALTYATKTDEAGRFSFLLPKMYGLRPMVVQVRPKEGVNLVVELADEFHETKPAEVAPFVLPPEWTDLAQQALVNAQVRQSYQAFDPPPVYMAENKFDSIPFFGRPDVQYFLDDFTRFPLPEFFFEVATEVKVRGKYGNEELAVLNEWIHEEGELPPLLLVDGVPVFDQRTFLKINNQLIASTEVVTNPFWLNPVLFDGVIQITSFEGDARCFTLPPTALRRSFLAFLPEQQFDTPDYEQNPDSRLPDFRNTLYWNPNIQTDDQGRATVRFYVSDAVGEYEVRVEGMSGSGLLGSASDALRVNRAGQ
jgi:hypothetical protein